jgi:hypothetical protein
MGGFTWPAGKSSSTALNMLDSTLPSHVDETAFRSVCRAAKRRILAYL